MNTIPTRPLRVAAIHDLSGFGRCSLSVILPVLSVMGVQVCPVPTAILSSHTGGLGDVASQDLTDFIRSAQEHYQRLNLAFEAVYSGFLNSAQQIEHCMNFYSAYPDALKIVDPVMGDHGKPYRTITENHQSGMKKLVGIADVITPNLTEACILLGIPFIQESLSSSMAKSLLVRLSEHGPKHVVITGASMATGEIANLGYDRENNTFWIVESDYVPVSYPGTGDIYASVLVGAFLTGDSLPIAMDRATKFVELAVKTTFSYASDTRYGVMLEKVLPYLAQNSVSKGYRPL